MGGLLTWEDEMSIGGHAISYKIIPIQAMTLIKDGGGTKIFTVTLLKYNQDTSQENSKMYDFEIMAYPYYTNRYASVGYLHVIAQMRHDFISKANSTPLGNISNIRDITYNGEKYLACDVSVYQFGGNSLWIKGIHNDISEIIDVTDNFSET